MKRHNSEQWIPVREALCRVLAQPLSGLVSMSSALVIEEAEQWSIPVSDREALRKWGLPRHPLFTRRPQCGPEPVLVPNRAGEYERRLVREGQRLYDLGYWGTDPTSCVVGVVPGEGRVLCLLPEPITVEDLPEILRPCHSGLYKPAVSLFNTSLAQYVETAWRWHAALQILRQIEEPAPTAAEVELVQHDDRLYACLDLVVNVVRRVDRAADAESRPSVWTELIRENSV
ncbi:SUKH-4 family immunity protein [Streptomyces sp. NPDC059766]|uniref:SUKH-4 family immunity protein n=1 Tax=Streptomyces sp. NPDC059766 TaxID=3346940 RepID=UPI00365DE3B4